MKITIIGGGIGGLCTAISLQKAGFDVKVYEGVENIKPLGAGLALSANAIKALQYIGIAEDIVKEGKVLKKLSILDEKGAIISFRNTETLSNTFGLDNFTIHRADLHRILMRSLKPGTLITNYKLKKLEEVENMVEIEFENGEVVNTECLIAADGIHSLVRRHYLPGSSPRYAGYTCWRAVIDKAPDHFDWESFSETWGNKGRFGIVPLKNNRIYWFACINAPYKDPFKLRFGVKDLLEIFKEYHFPVSQLIELTKDADLFHNDIMDIKPINQFAFNNVLLVGDAAHATTPNMGQGACQAIEDALFVANCLKKYQTPALAFKKFEKLRIKRTTEIVNTSRILGRVAQWDNKIMSATRNFLFKLIPESVNKRQLEFLYNVDFENV
ncbi:MAG TPA: FAD-dependent monooxygenase [Cytophagales bacterium]|nr:FAD-dependent monooxygenase [Cytophagales bacterium]